MQKPMYFIRPGGNYDPRTFDTLQTAIDAAIETVNVTGYSADVFDSIEKRGQVGFVNNEVCFINSHAYANR